MLGAVRPDAEKALDEESSFFKMTMAKAFGKTEVVAYERERGGHIQMKECAGQAGKGVVGWLEEPGP